MVEFLPGGGTRLVPIAIWIDDRFYDASLYAANPEPLAVEPQTVYQATDYGEPTGLFTVTTPKEVNGNWVADGRWTPHLAWMRSWRNKPRSSRRRKRPSTLTTTGQCCTVPDRVALRVREIPAQIRARLPEGILPATRLPRPPMILTGPR